jgi:dTDP-glucose 4,6-dehydratase
MAFSFYSSFETPVAIIRPFNTYGPRQSTRAVIPTIITQIAAGKKQIQLGATSPTRDFTFVDDTVEGFIKALHSDDVIGKVTNLGSGFEISIGKTASTIASLMGATREFTTDSQRIRPEKSEVERLFASYTRAEKRMGWTPLYGGEDGFKKGLTKTIEWFSDPKNLARYKTNQYAI